MGRSPSEKRKRSQAKRKTALQKKQAYGDLRAAADLFPSVVIEPGDAPESLAQAVRVAAKQIRVEHASILKPAVRDLFRDARKRGFGPVLREMEIVLRMKKGSNMYAYQIFLLLVGELIFGRLPREVLERHIPYNRVDVLYGMPQPNSILIRFRPLATAKSSGGTVYFARRRPTLIVGGEAKVVAFSRHAIERINTRTVGNPLSYAGSGDAFAFLDSCVYYEDCSAAIGHQGFTFYNRTDGPTFSSEYAREILEQIEPGRSYYYRVGYCPAVVEGDFIKAKTLLVPGMHGTPEHRALIRSTLPSPEKRRMLEGVERLTFLELFTNRDFSLLRWFHANGIPQVISLDREVFRYD